MANVITPVSKLVEEAKTNIEVIYPFSAFKQCKNGEIVFIDIRDIRELWREGKIEDSFHAPRGMLEFWIDPLSQYYKKIFSSNKIFVLYCASGLRSTLSAFTLKQMGMKNVRSLEGGLKNWKKCNLPTISVAQNDLNNKSYK